MILSFVVTNTFASESRLAVKAFSLYTTEINWVTYLALSIASVRCTLLSWPKQNRSPPEGSTYPSTVTIGQEEGTLNVSPT